MLQLILSFKMVINHYDSSLLLVVSWVNHSSVPLRSPTINEKTIEITDSTFGGENDKIAFEAEIAFIKFSVYILADSILCWHEYKRVAASPNSFSWLDKSYSNLLFSMSSSITLLNPLIFVHLASVIVVRIILLVVISW